MLAIPILFIGFGNQIYIAQAATTDGASGANPANTEGANGAVQNSTPFTLQNPLGSNVTSLAGLIQTFVDLVSYILILFAVLMLVYTGLQYILAQGNSERIKELHKQLLWIVIGAAIVIGARLIVDIVINTLQAANVVNSSTLQSVKNAASGN
jgi:heme/copper-type cytochrome/quinol oxidase subunit 2